MGSFRRGIRIFRSQDANIESRPSLFGKSTLHNMSFQYACSPYQFLYSPFLGTPPGRWTGMLPFSGQAEPAHGALRIEPDWLPKKAPPEK